MTNWLWKGRVWAFGDALPNDNGLMPISFTRAQVYDEQVLAKHCFEDIDPSLAARIQPGDLIVAGKNFGCGNPHTQGFLGLKGLGVAVLAESMSRGPLRACVNAGVPVLAPAPGICAFAQTGDIVTVDFEHGSIENLTQNSKMEIPALPVIMRDIVAAGGGIGFMLERLQALAARGS
jgi:3-isopropylmalate dehydratase small subunit